jgi:hypothetical protein
MDYRIDIQNPFMAGLQGFQAAQQMTLQQQQLQQQRAAQQRQAQMQQDLADFSAKQGKQPEDYRRMMTQYPEISKQINQSLSMYNEEQRQNKINQLLPVYAALRSNNVDQAKGLIDEYRIAAENSGDSQQAKTLDLLKQQIDIEPKGALTSSRLFLYGAMGEDAFLKMDNGLAKKPAEYQKTGMVMVKDNDTGQFKMLVGSYDKTTGDLSISEGTLPSNYTVVSDFGETPEEQRQRKVITQGETTAVQEAVKMGAKYADRSQKISENITSLDKAIGIIEEGLSKNANLGLGWVKSRLPKFDPFAIKMQQAAQELGLGVVTSVTFGALSESELEIAMSTAMPPTLQPQEALKWLKEKRDAQQKLKNEMDKAAAFIGSQNESGKFNTVADWKKQQLEMKKQKKETSGLPSVTSQAEYDALPSGSVYLEDGKKYRKP